jgi:acyl-CoA thioesterase-2
VHGANDTVFGRLVDLAIDPASPSTYIGCPGPEQLGRTFGGQFLAQGLAAAYRTVEAERRVHSLHAYFVRAGAIDQPTGYQVDVIRDGRSFAARAVTGSQGGRELFRMMASFHTPEDGFDYQPDRRYPVETVPRPDEVQVTYDDVSRQHPDTGSGPWDGERRPMDIRYINPPAGAEGVPVTEPQLMWLRIAGSVPPEPAANDAGLAYLADSTLVDHVMLPHGYRWQDARLTGTSLDHAKWFHRPVCADPWLLYDQRVEHTGGARGLATGRFYSGEGELLATCSQEGLMRWEPDPAGR